MTSLRIAWRNIWRNGRRTAITVVAVGLNTAVLIASFALIEGMVVHMIDNATQLVVGDGQVHAKGYLADRSIYNAIPDPKRIMAAAAAHHIDAAPRSYGYGLLSLGSKSAGATFWGVDPAAERRAFALPKRVAEGHYLGAVAHGGIVLGRKLAKSLEAHVGSKLVAVVQAADGSLGNELYQVVGILGMVSEDIDRSAAILNRADFEQLFLDQGRVHEIALTAHGRIPNQRIGALLPLGPKVVYETWRQLLPTTSDIINVYYGSTWLFALVFFLAAALGVMNTMLMATHDRVREYGVLKALGCTPWRILREVTAEAWMLALVSTIVGGALGVAMGLYLQQVGLDLTGIIGRGAITMGGVSFDPVWRAVLTPEAVIISVVTMWIICILAALYPAAKAARLDPAQAMSHV